MAKVPAMPSLIGEPALNGVPPGSPVMLISPEAACTIRSKALSFLSGPVLP